MFFTIIFYLLVALSIVSSNGVFEVKFTSLMGNEEKLLNVTVCIKEYQTIVQDDGNCRYGMKDISIVSSPNNVSTVSFLFTQTWPGSHSLIIKSNSIKTFKISQLRSGKTSWLYVTSNEFFKVEHRIACSPNYYGNECSKFCNPPIQTNEHFTCTNEGNIECIEGWNGKKCDKPLCTKGCGENGKCIGPNKCLCSNSLVQETCQECIPLPGCQNGYCSKSNECTCKEGWSGKFCNIKLDLCQIKNSCKNGGVCKSEKNGKVSCECQEGYFGKYCQKKRRTCNEHTCLNDGKCYVDNQGIPKCQCIHEFTGTYCQTKIIRSHRMNIKIKGGHLESINYTTLNIILAIIASIMSVLTMILMSILICKKNPKIVSIEKDFKKENVNISKVENEYTLEPKNFISNQVELEAKKNLSRNSSITDLKAFNNDYYTIFIDN